MRGAGARLAEARRVAAKPAEQWREIDRATPQHVVPWARSRVSDAARRVASRRVVGVGDDGDGVPAMFRFVNKNLAVARGSAEMATVDRVGVGLGIGIGVGVVGQPVPFDVYRESHHLLALGGAIGMRGSIKHETWDRRGSHLRMRMNFLDVSTPPSSFRAKRPPTWRRLSITRGMAVTWGLTVRFESCCALPPKLRRPASFFLSKILGCFERRKLLGAKLRFSSAFNSRFTIQKWFVFFHWHFSHFASNTVSIAASAANCIYLRRE